MKEMWTGVYPNKKEYKYEIRFRTDDKTAYEFVEEACRNAIDINWPDKESDPRLKTVTQETFKATDKIHHWLKVDGIIYDIKEGLIIEYTCPKCGKEYLFNPSEMEFEWNDCGWFTCNCGKEVRYEKI